MRQIITFTTRATIVLVIIFSAFSHTSLGEVIKLNINKGIADGSITVNVNTPFDIGSVQDMFDGNNQTLARTPSVNPLIITLGFTNPFNFIRTALMSAQTGVWNIETAISQQDLENKTGSYRNLFSNREAPENYLDTTSFQLHTVKFVRLTLRRTVGDNYVHLREWELYADLQIRSVTICPKDIYLIPGAEKQMTAIAIDNLNTQHTLDPAQVSWSTADTFIVSINRKGKVKAYSTGVTTIYLTYKNFTAQTKAFVRNYFEPELAAKKVVKVALVIENPEVPSQMHKKWNEIFGWNDPYVMSQQVARELNLASNGTVEFQFDTIHASPRFTKIDGRFISPDSIFMFLSSPWGWAYIRNLADAGRVKYDYNTLIEQYDLCSKRNQGLIDEVWVYSFPFAGLYESILTGPNAFWYNAPPLTGTSCTKLMPIMGFNYERTYDLAMHSFGHRAENALLKAYGGRWDSSNPNPNLFELFTRRDAEVHGGAHIGNIHFPANGTKDYEYDNRTSVITYADNWSKFPLLGEKTRIINCEEWGCTEEGYMKWWFSHLPKYKGITDGVLNDWWHYIVDFESATKLARATGGACKLETLTLRNPENPSQTVNGLISTYYEGQWYNLPEFSAMTGVAGTSLNFTLTPARPDYFGYRFTGYFMAPSDGFYTFYTSSDDGSKLYIGNTLVVDNDGTHAERERSGRIGLKAGKHAITVDYFERTGNQVLKVSYKFENQLKNAISGKRLFRPTVIPIEVRLADNDEQKLNTAFDVFPIPGSDEVFISGIGSETEIKIYDSWGKMAAVKRSESKEGISKLDVTDLKAGIYIIKINQGKTTLQKRIVIMK